MISLFRKIRHKLLVQNRVTQYLAYAGGEILVVMIVKFSPVRDLIWVENRNYKETSVPLGTG